MTFVSGGGGGSRFLFCLAVKVEDTGRRRLSPSSSSSSRGGRETKKTAFLVTVVGERKGKRRRPRCGTTVNESSKTTTASTNKNNSNDSNKNASKDLELPELLFGAASTSFALTVDAITSGLDFVQKVTSTEKPSSKYPPGPDFDSAFEMGQNPLKFIEKVKSRYGPVAGLRLAGENVILVSKPSVAKQVLIDDEASFTKKGTAFFPSSRLAGDGLLVTDGDVWRSQRRLSNPAFRKAAVETYAKAMNECIEETIRTRWRTNGERDIYEDFNEVTLQVVCRTLFGEDAVGTKGKEIVDSIRVAFEYFAKRSSGIEMILPEWFPLPSNISFNDAVDRLDNAVYAIIDKRLAEMEEPCFIACATQEMDLLDRLLSASLDDLVEDEEDRVLKGAMASSSNNDDEDAVTNTNRKKMSRKQLRDEVMTLIVAGQETSAIVLSWAVAFVAKDESFGERIAKEATEARILAFKRLKKIPLEKEQEECTIAEEVIDDDGNCKEPDSETIIAQTELTFESIKDLPFTEAIILETMRLKPPAYIVGRSNSISDVHLDENNKYDIPRGSTILVSPYLAHRDGQYWSKPNEFDPNRWLALDPETNQPYARTALRGMGYKNTYFPFGAGPRVCIGAQFAMLEAIILLACSCEKRRFDLPDDIDTNNNNNNNNNSPGTKGGGFPKDAAGITLRPESPVRMKVSAIRRKNL